MQQKHDQIMTIGTELIHRAAKILEMLSLKEGGLLAEGKREIYRAGQSFTYFAIEITRSQDDLTESTISSEQIDVRCDPVGCDIAFVTVANLAHMQMPIYVYAGESL